MKHRLMELKYWQITALAVASVALVAIAITVGMMFVYPLVTNIAVTSLLSCLQVAAYMATGWYVPGPFMDAYQAKKNQERIDAALDRLIRAFLEVGK